MRDNNWFSGLAFGLVAGLILAALLLASLSAGFPDWWNHDGAIVTTKDTLANWLVAIFSFVAALFLWLTLRATQDMAKETTRIGEAQTRAYLDIGLTHVGPKNSDLSLWNFRVSVRNSGQSPARQIYLWIGARDGSSAILTPFPDLGAGELFEREIEVIFPLDDNNLSSRGELRDGFIASVQATFLDIFSRIDDQREERRDFSILRGEDDAQSFRIVFIGDRYAAMLEGSEQLKIPGTKRP
ncbi:hypothetical protein [Tabrizicola sp.]|uniref:hypothetical protein n=1 Tax=Tabrizicola sp. TaxID=2005166 RepID=UPI0026251232|nr:hypothetical protein [Tabrizicola sp.]MDM7931379.1 hypothetical protein [Tabrizicola sp.]